MGYNSKFWIRIFDLTGLVFALVNSYGLLWFIRRAIPLSEFDRTVNELLVVNQGLILNFLVSIAIPVFYLVGIFFAGERSKSAWYFQTFLIGLAFSVPYMNIPAVFFLIYWLTKKVKKEYDMPEFLRK